MLRGINRQVIFEDEEDNLKFLETLKNYKAVSGYKLFAYCLMSNHIHLLIKSEKDDIALIVKRIAGSYVYWYNWKYKRKGHLFQDRFKSEPINDDAYLLTVVRYIHQNPVKSKLCKRLEDFKYSSYNEYLNSANVVDTDFCFDIVGREEFIRYNNEFCSDECLDIEKNEFRLTDEEAKTIINKISKCKNITEFQALPLDKRNKFLSAFRKNGLSIRQICRLTGVSFNVVRKF